MGVDILSSKKKVRYLRPVWNPASRTGIYVFCHSVHRPSFSAGIIDIGKGSGCRITFNFGFEAREMLLHAVKQTLRMLPLELFIGLSTMHDGGSCPL